MGINTIQAVFFDFDGVILDSTHIKTEAFRKMYQPWGEEIVSKVIDHHHSKGGISRVEKIAHYHTEFLKQPLSEKEHQALCCQFSESVKDLVVQCEWIPGARDFLEKYHEILPLYVVSGTPEDELNEIIQRRHMAHYFKEICGSPVRKTVHVERIVKRENYTRQRCFFIGDALTDMDAARKTYLHFIGIQGAVDFPEGVKVLQNCELLEDALRQIMSDNDPIPDETSQRKFCIGTDIKY